MVTIGYLAGSAVTVAGAFCRRVLWVPVAVQTNCARFWSRQKSPVADVPRPGVRRAAQGVRGAVLVGRHAAKQSFRGDDPVLLGERNEAGGVGGLEQASRGDGAHDFLTVISSKLRLLRPPNE